VRYGTAVDLVEQLYRGLADNTVSRVIDGLLRNDLKEDWQIDCWGPYRTDSDWCDTQAWRVFR
jgi:hypothetical protein